MKDQGDNILFIIHQNCRPDSQFNFALSHCLLRRNSRYSAIQGRINLAHISYISAVNILLTVIPRGDRALFAQAEIPFCALASLLMPYSALPGK